MQHLTKTDAGRAEIRARSLPLSRAARNLLFIIDADHDTDYWLKMVRGSEPADLQALIDSGLVAPAQVRSARAGSAGTSAGAGGTPSKPAPMDSRHDFRASDVPSTQPPSSRPADSAPASDFDADAPRMPLEQALMRVAFRELYDRLTHEAKPRLGLINGYRAILAIERATDIDALRAVAVQFIEQVRQAKGAQAAQESAQYLVDGRHKAR